MCILLCAELNQSTLCTKNTTENTKQCNATQYKNSNTQNITQNIYIPIQIAWWQIIILNHFKHEDYQPLLCSSHTGTLPRLFLSACLPVRLQRGWRGWNIIKEREPFWELNSHHLATSTTRFVTDKNLIMSEQLQKISYTYKTFYANDKWIHLHAFYTPQGTDFHHGCFANIRLRLGTCVQCSHSRRLFPAFV